MSVYMTTMTRLPLVLVNAPLHLIRHMRPTLFWSAAFLQITPLQIIYEVLKIEHLHGNIKNACALR